LFGIWIGISRSFDEVTHVVLHAGRQIPGLAWIPLAILWFGIGDATSVFVIALSSFFPTVIFTLSGVRNIDRVLLRAALTLGARRSSVFMLRTVILPGAIPQIMVGLRVAVASAWTSIVASEMVGSVSGVGYLIQFYRTQYRIDRVVFYMVVIAALGYLFDYLIRTAQARLLVWQAGAKAR
jgi:ABC-type nitrate/sulfonate/bicarbonate transport system permease component